MRRSLLAILCSTSTTIMAENTLDLNLQYIKETPIQDTSPSVDYSQNQKPISDANERYLMQTWKDDLRGFTSLTFGEEEKGIRQFKIKPDYGYPSGFDKSFLKEQGRWNPYARELARDKPIRVEITWSWK